MKLEYIGHACFRLTAADGTRVITDPYDASVGIAMLPLEAELVTMSHGHHDHCCEDMLRGAPRIVRGTQEARVGSVTTLHVSTVRISTEWMSNFSMRSASSGVIM